MAILVDPHKALSYQRALATFTRIVGEADSTQRLLQNATAQIARITDIRHVKALRYRPDKGDLLVGARFGGALAIGTRSPFDARPIVHAE